MSLFHRSPTSRLHHRLLDRLRLAYLLTEDLRDQRYLLDNQRLIQQGSESSHDDEALYANWTETEMPLPLARAVTFEQSIWAKLHELVDFLRSQGFYADSYRAEAEKLLPLCKALQQVLLLELRWVTHPVRRQEEALLNGLRLRVKEARLT